MKRHIKTALACFVLLPALCAWADEAGEARQHVNSRDVYAYYDAAQALAVARDTGKPIFVVSIRGNNCAGGL